MTAENVDQLVPLADAFIVGSTFRTNGHYLERLDPERLQRFMEAISAARGRRLPR